MAFDFQGITYQLRVVALDPYNVEGKKIETAILTNESDVSFLGGPSSGVTITGGQSG